MKYITLIFTLLFTLFSLTNTTYAKQSNCTKQVCSYDEGNLTFQYKLDKKNIVISISAKTNGWVAVGFNDKHKMKGATFIMGYINKDGKPMLSTEYGTSNFGHKSIESLGGSYKAKVLSSGYKDGITAFKFSLPLNPKDTKYGKVLKAGDTLQILLAYGPEDAKNFSEYHAFRKHVKLTL